MVKSNKKCNNQRDDDVHVVVLEGVGAAGGVGIPLIDKLPKLGNKGGGGMPASTAGSGTAMFSRGIVNIVVDDVPNKGVGVLLLVVAPSTGGDGQTEVWVLGAGGGGT